MNLRTELRPGDLGWIVHRHGIIYARECGFDHTFEAYVAGPLADFAKTATPRDRIWIAEQDGRFLGCIAIVGVSPRTAQLRWFLVEPEARGSGLGKRLLTEAVAFCKKTSYELIYLWTVSSLAVAAHLYRWAGFQKVEDKPGRLWSVDAIEEKYELVLK